ncbi:MAG: NAD-dependent epimerase/dehydratase family protein [Burkholderiaceae bacterium]
MRRPALPPVLPRRLRRPRLLIIGCGDVGSRLAASLAKRFGERMRLIGTGRKPASLAAIRALGALPLAIDLDDRRSAARLAGLAKRIVHLVPPPGTGRSDARSRRLAAVLGAAARPGAGPTMVYCGTTGVYGDAGGARLDETRPIAPGSDRARRRASGEHQLRALARRRRARVALLRAPGIYAHDRLPLERLRRGAPAIHHAGDSYSSRIHAEDLARLLWLALFRAGNCRVYNAVDSVELRMGEWFDRVADATGLPRPPRASRDTVREQVSPAMWSFMAESRRISNRRILRELRARLRYPDPRMALEEVRTRHRENGPWQGEGTPRT